MMGAMKRFFKEKIELALAARILVEALILDPKINFAKHRDDELTIFRESGRLQRFSWPVAVPISRKTLSGEVIQLPILLDRDAGTVACISAAINRSAQIFRVCNVEGAYQAVSVFDVIG